MGDDRVPGDESINATVYACRLDGCSWQVRSSDVPVCPDHGIAMVAVATGRSDEDY